MLAVGLKKKNFTVAMARGDIWLQRISCSAARGASAIATADQARAARLLAVLAVSGQQRNQIHHRPAGEAAVHWPAATRQMQPCSLAVWLSGSLSISLRLRKPSHRIGLQRCNRGRGGGARESRHVAEAPPKSGLAGKGGPWSPGKEIEGPLALDARSLAAVLEDAARASHSCCTVQTRLGKPAWGICGARRLLSYEVRPTQCRDGRKP
ncbi:hypothetical protein LI328DRAFT_171512 [Trichoderma asperelloides]|nr:hypothetical protein LI328DRAFT_171512 [Trichoderma asperelloides]